MARKTTRQGHSWHEAMRPALVTLVIAAALLSGCARAPASAFIHAAPMPPDAVVAYTTTGSTAAGDGVTGLRGRDGTPLWYTATIGRRINAPAVVVGGVLYAEGEMGSQPSAAGQPPSDAVVAVRLRDGALLWRTHVPAFELALTADETDVLVAAGSAGLFALDPADGSVRWHQAVNTRGSPHVGGGVVVVAVEDIGVGYDGPPIANADSGLWGFQERDGAFLWKGAAGSIAGMNQRAFYGNYSVNLAFARSLQDGHPLWEYESERKVNGLGVQSAVIGVSTQLVLLESDRGVVALDAQTGQVRWQSPQAFDGSAEFGGPIFAMGAAPGTAIYGSHEGEVIALRGSDGAVLWRTTVPDYQHGTVTTMLDVNGVVFVMLEAPYCSASLFGCAGPTYNRLAALDGATGAIYWWRDLPDGLLLGQAPPTA